jgi:hypothetical protein
MFKASLGKKLARSQVNQCMMVYTWNPSFLGGIARRLAAGKKARLNL